MAYLELRDVYFEYPSGHIAVEGVSISADLGEKIAIIGENGAGKTTTAKLMNGLLKPTKGEVLINGVSTKGKTTATIARKVAYVFQNPDDQIFNQEVLAEISYTPAALMTSAGCSVPRLVCTAVIFPFSTSMPSTAGLSAMRAPFCTAFSA